jgi:hypothetical protein
MLNILYITIICTILLLQGCTNKQKNDTQNIINMDTTLYDNVLADTLSPFQKFVNKFDYRELPFELKLGSKDWKDFSSKEPLIEISRSEALKFFAQADKDVSSKTKSGEYQHYFGYRIKLNDNIGLIYYRTSSDYTGYVLSVFDPRGGQKSSLFLSGVKGEYEPEAQKEAILGNDGVIVIDEIILNNGIDYSGSVFKANYTLKKYQLSLQGKINELSQLGKEGIEVKCDKTQRDRVVIIN